jgi:hypothetical protein
MPECEEPQCVTGYEPQLWGRGGRAPNYFPDRQAEKMEMANLKVGMGMHACHNVRRRGSECEGEGAECEGEGAPMCEGVCAPIVGEGGLCPKLFSRQAS